MGQVMGREDRLETREAIADYLGIDPKTLDAWRKRYGKQHPNPLPVGRLGRALIASKAELGDWRAKFTEHPEWQ